MKSTIDFMETSTMPKLGNDTTLTEAKAYLIWVGGSPYHGHIHGDKHSSDVDKLLMQNMAIAKQILRGRYDNVLDVDRIVTKIIDNVAMVRSVLDHVTSPLTDPIDSHANQVIGDYFDEMVGLKKKA